MKMLSLLHIYQEKITQRPQLNIISNSTDWVIQVDIKLA